MERNRGKTREEWIDALRGRFERGDWLNKKMQFIVTLKELCDWFDLKWTLYGAEIEIRKRMEIEATKQ